MISFLSSNLRVSVNEETGYTTEISRTDDAFCMNWVLPDADWGRPENFRLCHTGTVGSDGFSAAYTYEKDPCIRLSVQKSVKNGYYTEEYTFINDGKNEFFMTPEKIGIHFPLNCLFTRTPETYHLSCITHLWCGGSVCYLDSVKADGDPVHLVGILTEGSVDDYSIDYDLSRVETGADFRGAFVLHPTSRVLHPGNAFRLCFVFRFTTETPEALLLRENIPVPEADRYSLFLGKETDCRVLCRDTDTDFSVTYDGHPVPVSRYDGGFRWTCRAEKPGEIRYAIRVGKSETFMRLNALTPLADILEKRARFIVEKQQYRDPGCRLDGAYLIYDRSTGKQYYDAVFRDHNACRERIVMGIIVALQLQKKPDSTLMESLRLHRAFVEREVFDTETGRVYDVEGKGGKDGKAGDRLYDYPWVSVYYLEWYRLSRDTTCLLYAAKALFAFYERGGRAFEAQCIEARAIITALRENGYDAEAQKLYALFLGHADRIIETGIHSTMTEMSVASENPDQKIHYLSEAYVLSGDRRYLDAAQKHLPEAFAFIGNQPDYHMNGITVRYWDNYWFGKLQSYGDVFPQYWSVLSGLMLLRYTGAAPEKMTERVRRAIYNNFCGNLCVFFSDGFASSSYLYPYKITQWAPEGVETDPYMKPKTTYGHLYDDFANDQDWALYYAVKNDPSDVM